MIDVAWSQLLILAIIALIFLGPKELPIVLRTIGRWIGKIRRISREFQAQFDDIITETSSDPKDVGHDS